VFYVSNQSKMKANLNRKCVFESESCRIIETTTTTENLRRLSQAIEIESPILVQGEVGCGKSFLIRELAASLGLESTLVELHLDDQTDSKTLLGAYVCSDVPGEFLWQAGVITQAALNGRWLVIEDIDRAPLEVAASLSTLLERRRLYLPDKGKEVAVHKSFRIFGTRSIAAPADGISIAGSAGSINVPSLRHFSYFWHFVTIDVPTNAEIKHIVRTKFPTLLPIIVQKLFETYGLFNKTKRNKLTNRKSISKNTEKGSKPEIDSNNEDGSIGSGTANMTTTRLFTLRDLMKAAHRCTSHDSEFNRASGVLTEELRRHLLCEVIDVFASAVRDKERERGIYTDLVMCLGKCWGVPECDIDGLVLNAHPLLHRSDDSHRLENDNSSIRHSASSSKDTSTGIVTVGRVTLTSSPVTDVSAIVQQFAFNRHSLRMLERLAACVAMDEPVLLVGETGSGKTTSVQELANMTRRKLVVQNLSLSTDASDLFGGFRPVSLRQLFLPCYELFLSLFQETFSSTQNSEFVSVVAQTFRKQQWKKMLKAFLKAAANALQRLQLQENSLNNLRLIKDWTDFSDRSARFETNLSRIEVGFAFAFVDGLLVEAMRKGHWVLLDEINLAASETLQALAGVLDGQSLCLTEKGDVEPVPRHKDFRIFAAMNPPTDVGKKELPIALRSRFTELYAEEVTDPQDLRHVVERVLADSSIPSSDEKQIDDIVSVYLGCRATAEMTLADGAGQRPRFSLRSLTRSLKAAKGFVDIGLRPLNRALFEGFLLNFHTLLDGSSRAFMWTFLKKSLGVAGGKKELALPPSRPGGKKLQASDWILVKPFWLRTGGKTPQDWAERDGAGITRFVLTPTVEAAVRDLAAAVAAGVAPILLQGPTSVGKTSMIEYLAARTGHKCVRINNHEHTDVQEYVGGYVTNERGHLEFRDGLLVDALRCGHWIILDGEYVGDYD
jgi:midasin